MVPSGGRLQETSAEAGYERLQVIAHEKTHRKVLSIFGEMPSRGRLLDIPAGEGALAWQLRKLGYTVTGGDIDPAFFKVGPIPCVRIDMNDPFPIEDETFDFVSCIEGIEHLQDPFQFVRECRRILRPTGTLVLSTPNILNLASRLKYLLCGFYSLVPRPINEFSVVPVFDHIHPATYYQIRYMLHSQGFEIVRVAMDFPRRSAAALLFLRPLVLWYSRRTMRKETDPRQIQANKEIRRVMASRDILLGRTLIVVARRKPNHEIRTIQASEI